MIIVWKGDYDGDDLKRDLPKLDEINKRIWKKVGGEAEGPYFPQDASILYIFRVSRYEQLNEAGRLWFAEVSKAGLPFTPLKYEVCVTPTEFFG
jgi:hypothetical protein